MLIRAVARRAGLLVAPAVAAPTPLTALAITALLVPAALVRAALAALAAVALAGLTRVVRRAVGSRLSRARRTGTGHLAATGRLVVVRRRGPADRGVAHPHRWLLRADSACARRTSRATRIGTAQSGLCRCLSFHGVLLRLAGCAGSRGRAPLE